MNIVHFTFQEKDGTILSKIMCAVTTGEFLEFQMKNNICIDSNVVLRPVSVVGLTSTGSHVSQIYLIYTNSNNTGIVYINQ